MKCVIVPLNQADSVLKELNALGCINREYRITRNNGNITIPLINEDCENYPCVECNPPLRIAGMSPLRRIELDLLERGIEGIQIPEKWVRYGDSIVLRLEADNEETIAREFMSLFGIKAVYKLTGGVEGVFRTPSVKLVAGRGGDIVHIENGIKFVFDPRKIMFSPGNVNERVSVSSLRLKGKRVLDMFCGIGYFSLPIAKYSGSSEIVAIDINPEAIRYLWESAKANRVESVIRTLNADSFSIELKEKFDLIVMGNFRSIELLEKALSLTSEDGRIILHHLVSKENMGRYQKDILLQAQSAGFGVKLEESHRVKSYSPNVWHYSTTLIKTEDT